MPKYLLQVSYTAEGAKGLQKEGGTKRRKAAQGLVESLGGKLETLYFAFGDCDVIAIADMPDSVSVEQDRGLADAGRNGSGRQEVRELQPTGSVGGNRAFAAYS
jgi:uncharacterized protein with GYD domain